MKRDGKLVGAHFGVAGSCRGKGVRDVLVEGRGEDVCETERLLLFIGQEKKR